MIHIFFLIQFVLQSEPVCSARGKAISDTLTCSLPSAENVRRRAAQLFECCPVGAMVHVPVVTLGYEMGRWWFRFQWAAFTYQCPHQLHCVFSEHTDLLGLVQYSWSKRVSCFLEHYLSNTPVSCCSAKGQVSHSSRFKIVKALDAFMLAPSLTFITCDFSAN